MVNKQKKLIFLVICLSTISLSVGWSTIKINGRIIIDPPDVPPGPVFLSKPSDKTVYTGETVRITWTAYSCASTSSRRAYIYVNGVLVKSYSYWSNRQALYYDFSRNIAGTYSIKCKSSDSYGYKYDTAYVNVKALPQWTIMFYLDGDSDPVVHEGAIFKDNILKNLGSNTNVQFISLLDLSDATSKYCYYGVN